MCTMLEKVHFMPALLLNLICVKILHASVDFRFSDDAVSTPASKGKPGPPRR